jgi:hypothetical protein
MKQSAINIMCVYSCLVIRHANRIFYAHYIVKCALSVCTISHKWHDFRKKKKLLNIKYALIFSASFI